MKKKSTRILIILFVLAMLISSFSLSRPNTASASDKLQVKDAETVKMGQRYSEPEEGILIRQEQNESGVSLAAVTNASELTIKNVRFDLFQIASKYNTEGVISAGMAIKYIDKDTDSPDAMGKWRNVYCLNYKKSSPTCISTWTGWANKKVHYAMYYGCVYWNTYSRYKPYSANYYNTSGTDLDWRIDYVATQLAVHILNGEFTLADATDAVNKADPVSMKSWTRNPTANEKECLIKAVTRIVNDANKESNYSGYTTVNGRDWMLVDPTTSKFNVTGYEDTWTKASDGNYYSGGDFHITFTSYYGYDMRDQIKSLTVSVPSGVMVKKADKKTFSDFDLYISKDQFMEWQKTGKDITVTVTMKIPKLWGAAEYTPSDTQYQPTTFMSYSSGSNLSTFEKTITLHIPKVVYPTGSVIITKTDLDTGTKLSGAVFKIYAWDGNGYTKDEGHMTDQGDGTYSATVTSTDSNEGKFKIVEEQNPTGYTGIWTQEFVIDRNGDPDQEFQFTATNPQVTQPFNIVVKKKDAVTGNILKDCNFTVYEYDSKTSKYVVLGTLGWDDALKSYTSDTDDGLKDMLHATFGKNGNQGKFKIVETSIPDGYVQSEPWTKEFTVTASDTDRVLAYSFEAENSPTRILIRKVDENGNDITGAHLKVFDAEENLVTEVVTDSSGVEVDRLVSGETYIIREGLVPDGYVQAEDVSFQVKDTKEVQEVEMKDLWTRTVFSKRSSADKKMFVSGASLELRRDKTDASSVVTTITGEKVRWTSGSEEKTFYGIKPGIYWLVETKAPAGYAVAEPVEVEVKASITNGAAMYDMPYTDLTVVKRIKANEINFANGNPTFIFTVKGNDTENIYHEYSEFLEFTEAYVKSNTGADGYVSMSHTWKNIPTGPSYCVTEETVNRYYQSSVTSSDKNVDITQLKSAGYGQTADETFRVAVDLLEKPIGTKIVFTNTKYTWGNWGHNSVVKNIVEIKK